MIVGTSDIATTTEDYRPDEIEPRWQGRWRRANIFATPEPAPDSHDMYVFAACPFTSGSTHMGHIRSYTLSDAYARFCRARGETVLFSLGFDAFGLPAELGAIRSGETPRVWVDRCVESMRHQFDRMGYSFDWSRLFVTCEPDIYRWTQWLFLILLERNLIYRDSGEVNWCDACGTTLAALQAQGGRCWRCHGRVRLRYIPQWYLRVRAYTDENVERLCELTGWNKLARGAQRNASGAVSGVEIVAETDQGSQLTVFTPHADALDSASLVILSPNHHEVGLWSQRPGVTERLKELHASAWRHTERDPQAIPVLETGWTAHLVGTIQPLPIVISPTVDVRCGPSAILGIPSVDRVDAAIASQLRLPATQQGLLRVPRSHVSKAVRYRAGDFPVSRQRGWGTPIPLVNCDACGVVPVPKDDLPVLLPDVVASGAAVSLADHPAFRDCACPQCGAGAQRETDTLDCHFDGLWFWMAPCVPREARAQMLFEHPELNRWLPIAQVIWGSDGGGYMFDIRMITKALRDAGYGAQMDGEPYESVLMHEMVRIDGRKMSKHLGNAVEPDELIRRAGADAMRLAVAYAAAPAKAFGWDDALIDLARSFLDRLWLFGQTYLSYPAEEVQAQVIDRSDPLRIKLDRWCEAALRRITEDFERLEFHKVARNAMFLLARIEGFEKDVLQVRADMNEDDCRAVRTAMLLLIRLIAPLTPHVAEELWAVAGGGGLAASLAWPG